MKNTKRKAKEVSNTARPPRRSSTRKQVTLTPYPEASPSRPRSPPPRPAPRTCSTPPSSQPWVLKVSAHTRFLPQRFLLSIQIPARWTTSTTDHYQIQSGFLSMVAVWPVSMIIKSATCPIVPQNTKTQPRHRARVLVANREISFFSSCLQISFSFYKIWPMSFCGKIKPKICLSWLHLLILRSYGRYFQNFQRTTTSE